MVYASAINGYAGDNGEVSDGDMTPLFEAIVEHVPAPDVDVDGPFQLQISTLDYNSYVGIIGIGRIRRGTVKTNMAGEDYWWRRCRAWWSCRVRY